jgi:transcription antitermination factor NusG
VQGLAWCPVGNLLNTARGDDMDEHREAAPFPRKGQQVRVVDGPFTGYLATVVDDDELPHHVQVVVQFFGREENLRMDVLQLEAAP